MNPRIQEWQGRRVWVIGASSGTGAALARALAARGARVAVSPYRGDSLEPLGGVRGLVLSCDLLEPASLAAAWSGLLAAWGGVEVVLYAADDYTALGLADLEGEGLAAARRMMALNLAGAVELVALVARVLPPGGGIGFVGGPPQHPGLVYGSTKAALLKLAEALALDLVPRGVGVWVTGRGGPLAGPAPGQSLAGLGAVSAEETAQAILVGLGRGAFAVYGPARWRSLAQRLRLLPGAAGSVLAGLHLLAGARPHRGDESGDQDDGGQQ